MKPRILTVFCLLIAAFACAPRRDLQKATPRPLPFVVDGETHDRSDRISREVSILGRLGTSETVTFDVPTGEYRAYEIPIRLMEPVALEVTGEHLDPVIHVFGPRTTTWGKAPLIALEDRSSGETERVEIQPTYAGDALVVVTDYEGRGGVMTLRVLGDHVGQDGGVIDADAGLPPRRRIDVTVRPDGVAMAAVEFTDERAARESITEHCAQISTVAGARATPVDVGPMQVESSTPLGAIADVVQLTPGATLATPPSFFAPGTRLHFLNVPVVTPVGSRDHVEYWVEISTPPVARITSPRLEPGASLRLPRSRPFEIALSVSGTPAPAYGEIAVELVGEHGERFQCRYGVGEGEQTVTVPVAVLSRLPPGTVAVSVVPRREYEWEPFEQLGTARWSVRALIERFAATSGAAPEPSPSFEIVFE